MTELERMLATIKVEKEYKTKTQLSSVVVGGLERKAIKPNADDSRALVEFALSEVERLIDEIRSEREYKKKFQVFEYEDNVLGMLHFGAQKHQIRDEDMLKVRELVLLVDSERFVENAVNKLFEQESISGDEARELIGKVSALTEEYHRGVIYSGLIHYRSQKRLSALTPDAAKAFGDYISAELERYLARGSELTKDEEDNLEYAVDACADFMSDRIAEQLYRVLKLSRGGVSAYAVITLAKAKRTVPAEAVAELAVQPTYAVMVYEALKHEGLESLFPVEYSTPEYLAKSELIRWLTYPTELGKEPDEIEYLGCRKVKREMFYVFRYRSDSEALGEDLVGKWLIGWASFEGGTFSNFDLYEPFIKKTPEKTLKHIVKKLIG
ncbi:MAG: hypothetical protein IJY04_09310 [Clostridia bacterium]|nr:hypothetical protein [Clostridia bacterium]